MSPPVGRAEEERIYHKGYRDGYDAGLEDADERQPRRLMGLSSGVFPTRKAALAARKSSSTKARSKPKKGTKGHLLSTMADKAWRKYKREYPRGKKTYITIRAQVSRSQLYKRRAKRLK